MCSLATQHASPVDCDSALSEHFECWARIEASVADHLGRTRMSLLLFGTLRRFPILGDVPTSIFEQVLQTHIRYKDTDASDTKSALQSFQNKLRAVRESVKVPKEVVQRINQIKRRNSKLCKAQRESKLN